MCAGLKDFERAVELLVGAECTMRYVSSKVAKLVRWEILYVHLISTKAGSTRTITDLDSRVKACLYSLKADSGTA